MRTSDEIINWAYDNSPSSATTYSILKTAISLARIELIQKCILILNEYPLIQDDELMNEFYELKESIRP